MSTSVENNCIKTHTFETDINFVRTQKRMHDIFNMKLQPLSESVSILCFVYKPCEKASLIFLPTVITNLGGANETICLRNPVRGVMEINRILELSLISEPPLDNFLSGQITFHANLCLSRSWLYMAWITGFDAKDFYFLICTNNKTKFGEDYLIWKSNLAEICSYFPETEFQYIYLAKHLTLNLPLITILSMERNVLNVTYNIDGIQRDLQLYLMRRHMVVIYRVIHNIMHVFPIPLAFSTRNINILSYQETFRVTVINQHHIHGMKLTRCVRIKTHICQVLYHTMMWRF